MSKRRLYAVVAGLGVTTSVALALLFGIFQAGQGAVTGVETTASGLDAEGANDAASALGSGYGEGIKLHGDWTIEVRNPDGGLVELREFDNALSPNGDIVLARIIAGISTIGHWQLVIDSSVVGNGPCGQACLILESSDPETGGTLFRTLTVDAPLIGANVGKLVLSGSATATSNGEVNVVRTVNGYCEPTLAPSTNCVGAASRVFNNTITFASISPPVSVSAGQQILVTVLISFS